MNRGIQSIKKSIFSLKKTRKELKFYYSQKVQPIESSDFYHASNSTFNASNAAIGPLYYLQNQSHSTTNHEPRYQPGNHQNSEYDFFASLSFQEFKNELRKKLLKIDNAEVKKSYLVLLADLFVARQFDVGSGRPILPTSNQSLGDDLDSSKQNIRRKNEQMKILDFMHFINSKKVHRNQVNQLHTECQSQSTLQRNQLLTSLNYTPEKIIQDSFQSFYFSSRVFFITQLLYSMGFDIQESMLVTLLKSTIIDPDHFFMVGVNQHEYILNSLTHVLSEPDRQDLLKHFKTRDYYLWKSIHQVEVWIKEVEAKYSPSMVFHLVESYLSIREWNIAFGRLLDAKQGGLCDIPLIELEKLYTMVLKKCQYEKSPCVYIVSELRYEMIKEGVRIQNELGTVLIQCCLTAGDYASCAEVLREWNPVREKAPMPQDLQKKLASLFPNIQ